MDTGVQVRKRERGHEWRSGRGVCDRDVYREGKERGQGETQTDRRIDRPTDTRTQVDRQIDGEKQLDRLMDKPTNRLRLLYIYMYCTSVRACLLECMHACMYMWPCNLCVCV